MKRLSIIILALAALVAGCTREDDIKPITPTQSDQIRIQRIFSEKYVVLERLDNLTGRWDTLNVNHIDKYLAQEWFWNGDRLDSIIDRNIDVPITSRFTYDNNGLLTRYEHFIEGERIGQYSLFHYDAEGRLSKFESYLEDTLSETGIIDSYVGDKISHMKYKDYLYDVDINYIFTAGNVTEMVVNGIINGEYLHIAFSYTYDNNPNPFSSCLFNIIWPRDPYKWVTANNVLTEFTRTVEGDMEARDTRIDFEYRYENNIPVEKNFTLYTGNDNTRLATISKEYYEY